MVFLDVDVRVLAVVAFVVLLGSAMQGLVGLGLNLVSAPIITLLEPSLMPELALFLAVLLPFFTLARSHREIDWRGLGWVLSFRLPGTALGVLFLALFSEQAVAIAVGVMVLVAVLLSLTPLEVPVNRVTLGGAGLLSGLAGTATSIGGPPVALLYQRRSAEQIRSTLAVLFTVGAAMSLVAVGLSGHFDPRVVGLALLLTPCLLVGAWIGARLQPVLGDREVRYAVLAICAVSALVLLIRSLL